MHDMSSHAVQHHAPPTRFLRKYVFSTRSQSDRQAVLRTGLCGGALCGMVLSWLMRFHLGWNNTAIPGLQLLSKSGAPGGVMTPEFYLQLMTMHGTIMVFFVLTTAPFAAFGNFFLPIQVGAEDMPFPRFNMMSFWVTFVAFVVLMASFRHRRWTNPRRMDAIRAAQRRGRSCRPRPGHGRGSLDDFDCAVLRWPVAGLVEFHPHHARSSGQRHEPDAHAAHCLGMVHYVLHGADCICRADAGVHPRHSRPRCRNQLLRALRTS